MSDPTKQETEEAFRVLKSQKANKVRSVKLRCKLVVYVLLLLDVL